MTTTELLELTRKWERGELGDEEFVRAVWTDIMWTMGPNPWTLRISFPRYFDGTQNECWQAAAEFTRYRIEEVRQLEKECDVIDMYARDQAGSYYGPIFDSIQLRLTALLAEATRGMK